MRVVVVGATGNVGTSLLHALERETRVESVVGIARRLPALRLPKVEWMRADVTTDELEPLFEGADAVVHLAWAVQPSRNLPQVRRVNVDGSARVFAAVRRAGVGTLVYASSVGAYSAGPKDRPVDESWPTFGIPTSFYGRHKAEVERILDAFELEAPGVRVVRLRPGLIFKREAAAEVRRLFAGPFLPGKLLHPKLLRVVPDVPGLRVQAVHADDVAEAYRLALVGEAHGAFNIAAEPVLDAPALARLFEARLVPVSASALKTAAALTYRLRLQPTRPGWIDLALGVPLLDSTRARDELGWEPARSSTEAVLELLEGLRHASGTDTPPLARHAGGILRMRELRTGVGARDR
jgi:UDP-glucose 4-epimerase